jgi:hypothetical protein
LEESSETRIQVCGPLVVRIQGHRVESALSNRQLRLLFVYMLLNRRDRQTRDELIDALWVHSPPAVADSALSALLSKLRHALSPEMVQGRSHLQLMLPSDAFVDYEVASLACHQAESSIARADWTRAYWSAKIVYAISSQGFLPGEDLPWVNDFRRRLEEVFTAGRSATHWPLSDWAGLSWQRLGGPPVTSSSVRPIGRSGTGCSWKPSPRKGTWQRLYGCTRSYAFCFERSWARHPVERYRSFTSDYLDKGICGAQNS